MRLGPEVRSQSQTWLRVPKLESHPEVPCDSVGGPAGGLGFFSSLPRDSTGSQGTEPFPKCTIPWQVYLHWRWVGRRAEWGQVPKDSPSPCSFLCRWEEAGRMSLLEPRADSTPVTLREHGL